MTIRLITFALMASTPVIARSTNSTEPPRSLLTAFNLSANVRFPDGSNDGVHVKRLPGDLESTLGEERASVPLPKSLETIVVRAVSSMVTAIHSHGQNLAWVPMRLKEPLRSLDSYAIHQYLECVFPAPFSELPHEKERQLKKVVDTILTKCMPVKNSLDSRNMFISDVREVLSMRQQTALHNSLDRLMSLVEDRDNTPGKLFKELAIAVDDKWTTDYRMVNPFASPYFEVLKTYVQIYNVRYRTTMKLLDIFIEVYEGEAQVASMLSMARLSSIYGSDAQQMQQELFVKWVEREMTIGGVAKLLVSRITNSKNLLHFRVMDPLKGYILLFTRRYSIPEQYTAKILHLLRAKEFSPKALMKEVKAADSKIDELLKFNTGDIENYAQGLLMYSPQN